MAGSFNMQKGNQEVVTSFLLELFARFVMVNCIVSDNTSQFICSDFKEFSHTFSVEHVTIDPRNNDQAERFVNSFKRALRKVRDILTDKATQQFLDVYKVTPN